MVSSPIPTQPGRFTADNLAGTSIREGVEIAARVKLASNLSWGAAYTFTKARDPDGQEEVRRPPHSARTDLGYTFADGRGSANLGVIYNGRMRTLRSSFLTSLNCASHLTTTGSSMPPPPINCSRESSSSHE